MSDTQTTSDVQGEVDLTAFLARFADAPPASASNSTPVGDPPQAIVPTIAAAPPEDQAVRLWSHLFTEVDRVLMRPLVPDRKKDGTPFLRADYKHTLHRLGVPEALRQAAATQFANAANSKAGVYFGVNPREGTGGRFDESWQIRTVRCIWGDLDHCPPAEALQRCETAGLPRPSAVVSSGNGTHLYWFLQEPYLIDDAGPALAVEREFVQLGCKTKCIRYFVDPESKERVFLVDPKTGKRLGHNVPDLSPKAIHLQDIVAGVADAIGGDHVQDLARLLRVPGSINHKPGRESKPCVLVEISETRYPLEVFERFAAEAPTVKKRKAIAAVVLPVIKKLSPKRADRLAGLVAACSTAQQGTRSEADFAVCAFAVEQGIDREEIWMRVADCGKFAERGREYFDRTMAKAEMVCQLKIIEKAEKEQAGFTAPRLADDDGSPAANVDGLLEIPLTHREADMADMVIQALADDPSLYVRGGVLVHVVHEAAPSEGSEGLVYRPESTPTIRVAPAPYIRSQMTRYVVFTAEGEDSISFVPPPRAVVADVHSRGIWPGIRPLSGVTSGPILRPDGTVLTVPGWDKATGLLYVEAGEPVTIPLTPTLTDAQTCAAKLLEVVQDFPFAAAHYRSGWLALLLSLVARAAIAGPVPVFVIDANCAGTGKTMLAELAAVIAFLRGLARTGYTDDDKEMSKKLLAISLCGDQVILWDNIADGQTFGGGPLDMALTSQVVRDRILGGSVVVEAPMTAVFIATGNSIQIKDDSLRRLVYIRLETDEEHPEERADFQKPNLLGYVREQRRELLTAALTILRGYFAAGKPQAALTPLGSFDAWSDLIRGCIAWLGLPDPLQGRRDLAKRVDTKEKFARAVIANWSEMDPEVPDDKGKRQRQGITAAEIVRRVKEQPTAYPVFTEFLSEAFANLTPRGLGKKLTGMERRIIDGQFLISHDNRNGIKVWTVQSHSANPAESHSGAGFTGFAGFPHTQYSAGGSHSENGDQKSETRENQSSSGETPQSSQTPHGVLPPDKLWTSRTTPADLIQHAHGCDLQGTNTGAHWCANDNSGWHCLTCSPPVDLSAVWRWTPSAEGTLTHTS